MKKIYSLGKALSLLSCLIIITQFKSFGQCLNQGTIANPACGGTTTQPNVGNGQEWDLQTTNGADYSVSISAGSSTCGGAYTLSTTSFTGNGGTQTENVLSGGICCWAAGATSAVLTYTRIAYTNTTSNANMCQGSQRTLTLNATPLTFGAWQVTPGTGTATVSGSTLTAGNPGTIDVAYVQGGCTSNSVTITIDPSVSITSAPAGAELCETSTFTYIGSPAGGTWSVTGNGGINAASGMFTPASILSPTASQSSIITYTKGTCDATSGLTVYATPTTATVGATQNLCGTLSSGVLGGNTPVVGTGTWALQSGPSSPTFSNPNSGSSIATVTVYGTYVYTWTISNGPCSSSANVTVNYYETPTTATVGPTQDLCGTLTSASLGGNTPAAGTGTWTQTSGPGSTTFSNVHSGSSTATASIPGSYTYTWTISNGTCTPSSASTTVNFVATPSGGTIANTSYCTSAGTGVVSVVGVSNATEYQWALPAGLSGSSGTATITVGGTTPGNYTVTVTPVDTALGLSCSGAPITGVVSILGLPVIDSVNSHNITCFGYSNDTITVFATSTNGSLFYSIDGGTVDTNTTGVFPGIGAGSYYVYVKDDSGCSTTYALNPVKVTQPATGLYAASVTTPVGCHGDSAGSINLLASGGAGGYLYSWSTGQTIQIISGLPAGIYTGSVTDINGCVATVTDTLISPPAIVDNITKDDVTCYGAGNGKAFLTVSGGEPPYRVLWDNFDTTYDIAHLRAGVYRVQITDTFGCVHSDSIKIKRPPLLTAPMTVSGIKCFGTNLDTVTITAAGGNPGGYTYTWSPSVSSGNSATGLAPGQYIVTVSDINGCSVVDTADITQPLTPVSVTSLTAPVGCAGDSNGSINLLASGGLGGYTYSWSSGQSTQIITGLGAGTYTGSATDANGCVASLTDILQNPPTLFSGIEATNVSCNGYSNGTLFLTVSGGVQPYNVLWNNDDTSYYITGVSAGQYGVVVTDSYGCKQIDTVTITQPTSLAATVTVVNIGCNGGNTGSVTVTATGGTPGVGGYIYSWAPPVLSTTDSAAGLAAGSYTVTVSDSLGCSTTVSGTVTQPSSGLSATAIVSPVTCNNDSNGSITVLASGGSGGYTYTWTGTSQTTSTVTGLPAGDYGVTVSDGAGCSAILADTLLNPALITANITKTNVTCFDSGDGTAQLTVAGGVAPYTALWDNFDTTFDINHLATGLYRVIITDANGCSLRDSVRIDRPALLQGTIEVSNVQCFGTNIDKLNMIATGGNPGGYTYTWSPPVSSGPTVTGVAPGLYIVTVTDIIGCLFVDSATITQPLSPVSVTGIVTPLKCNNDANGSIFLLPAGGVGGYTYAWSNGDTTQYISNLPSATYTATVTDANGCQAIYTDSIINPAPITDVITSTNVTCALSATGSATVAASGGTPGYTYLWSDFETTATISGLNSGIYRVIITDTNGCEHHDSIVISSPAPLSAMVTVVNNACNGANTGSVTVSVTGGTPGIGGYLYSWAPPVLSTTDSAAGLGAGTYTVTVSDSLGCSVTASGTVTQPLSAITLTQHVTPVICNSDSNGSITITLVTGGGGGYIYNWSTGQTTPAITGLPAGDYTVSVTDANGCVATLTDTLTNPAPITDNLTSTNVHPCYGDHNGTVTVAASGGVSPLTLLWSEGDTTTTITHLTGDRTYTVTITDANGCQHDDSIRISRPSRLRDTITVSNVVCAGSNVDTISVSASGSYASGGYTYTWSPNVSSGPMVTGVAPGTYYLTVTDTAGCTSTDSATITQPASILTVASEVTQITCNNLNNGSILILASGGVGTYLYSWSSSPDTTQLISSLPAGIYTGSVTDANGCVKSVTDTIVNPSPIADTINGTNVTCAGASNGSAVMTVGGGTPGYTFLWSNFETTQSLDSISGGLYRVIITDSKGCEHHDSIIITEPQPIVATVTVRNVGCSGGNTGSVVVSVTGGTPGPGGYTYSWSPVASSTDSVSGVGAGTYTVTISDANGCSITASGTVTQIASNLSAVSIVNNITCNNANDGSITVLPSGGSGGYTYTWTGTSQTTSIASNLSAGPYSVTVTDGNGCTVSLADTITNPSPIADTITGVNVTCAGANNGSITMTVGGGTPGYTFLWSNFETTQNLDSIGGGLYRVIITDHNGCQHDDSIIITEPQPLNATVTVRDVACHGGANGAVIVAVTGGTPGLAGYTYSWSPIASSTDSVSGVGPGTYNVTITDANSCNITASGTVTQPATAVTVLSNVVNVLCGGNSNGSIDLAVNGGTPAYTYAWSGGQQTQNIGGLGAGIDTVTVTDANGCSVVVNDTVKAPAPITDSISGTNVTCAGANNGSVTLTVSGGSLPYSFLWSNFSGSQNLDSIPGAYYYVIITDANGCQKKDSIDITEPLPLVLSDSVVPIGCSGASNGAIYITATGGTGAYSYAWTPSEPNSADITGLSAGTYAVTVSDANHCSANLSVNLIDPPFLSVNYVVTEPRCNGDNNGSITISANGGSPGYTYAWTGTSGGAMVTNLSAGTYDVTVTDSHGCSVADTIVMNQPGPMYVSGIQKNISCHDLNDGQILPTGYGGTLPYSYQWYLGTDTFAPLGPITQNIIQLAGGNYYLVITDVNGCEATFSRTIINPDTLLVTLSDSNIKCAGAATGYVLASVTGGTVPYQYLWNNFTTDSFQTAIPAGIYAVVVTDSNGCHQNQSIDVTQPAAIGITPAITNPSCSYSNDGEVVVNVQGGTGAYTYSWNTVPVQTADSATGLVGGSYILVVTDANSCTLADTFSLIAPPALEVNTALINPICSGGSTGEIALSVTGGSEPYGYNWSTSPAQSSHIASLLAAGTYTATITDSKGCNLYDTATLVAPQPVTVTLAQGTTSCAGAADGTIIVNATGGLPPYLYTVGAVTQSGDTFTNIGTGSYSVEVSDANGCEGSIPFVINPRGTLTDSLIASPDVILAGQTVQLSAMATSDSGVASYTWYPSDSLNFGSYTNGSAYADSVTVMPTQTQDYTVVVTDSGGCSVTSTVRVYVSAQPDIFIPSAFTPNNDGLNDYFQFAILGATTINVQIWNNWGDEVYSNPAQPNGLGGSNGWDGTYHGQVVPFGTYTYQLVVTYFDGHTQTISGTVVVMP